MVEKVLHSKRNHFKIESPNLVFAMTDSCCCGRGIIITQYRLGLLLDRNGVKNVEKSLSRVHIIEYFVYFCVKFAFYVLFCREGMRLGLAKY